ncbi:plastocyanin/azurin family copper-binding protein [Leisingera daeponensis]|uniref:plastocyanin/azurin family copper-binding protein n=1 Tax=Leisingera daeponensis TaxID=405746 RepID=UPI000562E49E|nr:plastocyanin/azurin family copper-binding protein [Leisingera daeponensis]
MKRIIAGLAVATSAALPVLAEEHRVTIRGMAFEPALLEVAVGDTVTFVSTARVPHTASAIVRGLDAGREGAAAFDTGRIEPASSVSITIFRTGAIDYVCEDHPSMRGRIVAN